MPAKKAKADGKAKNKGAKQAKPKAAKNHEAGSHEIGPYNPLVLEPEILQFWEKNRIYAKAKKNGLKGEDYYFLDGPPYTSGKVHIGTAWNKTLKDLILRYKRMQGFNVWDRAGYDMHGLPTEHATEKKLGIKGKEDILKFGVDRFTRECEHLSVENMKVMNRDFMRLGVWMDFENAYQSIKKEFIEGEWWLIKKAHENNRLYEGKRTMTWCASCATVVAKHELEYKTVKENSIFLKFAVEGRENEFLIIWTTTPWTIPFNMAVMANPELEYVRAKLDNGETWILAKALAGMVINAVAGKDFKITEEFTGDKLEGLKYIHPLHDKIRYFDEIKDNPKLHTVILSEEYVDTSAGSGLVHCASGCGQEDYEVGHRNGLPPFNTLDEQGVFENIGEFNGLRAKKDDKSFIDALEKTGALIAVAEVEHEYAHCWRCKSPVIFRPTTQWFFKVEDLKEEMIKENDKIKWVPESAYNAFNSWLRNLRDNSITKQRYWGTPLPVWRCNKCKNYIVVDSVKELEKLSGQKVKDLHKPWIDEIKIKCRCGGTKERIPDILDVWVDAGTVSWNCLDYPHTKENFERLFPAEFILEGKDQIRGWFNLLHVASMVSMKKPSFRNVYMHGFVQDAQGRKMSKSLGNYILPQEVIDRYGADTFRFYSIGGTKAAMDLNYNFEDMGLKNRNLTILWNLHKFLIDYSNSIGKLPSEINEKLAEKNITLAEKYIISKMNSAIYNMTAVLDSYMLCDAPWKAEELFLELSRAYIQMVREKSSMGTDDEKEAVLYTMNKVFMAILKLCAPIMPFIAEKMYLNLKRAFGLRQESVHLLKWPEADTKRIDEKLEKQMDTAKNIMQAILSAREKAKIGVRWPIKQAIIKTANEEAKSAVNGLMEIIKAQTNVKDIRIKAKVEGVREKFRCDFKKLEASFGVRSAEIIGKLAVESPETVLGHIEKEGRHRIRLDNKDTAEIMPEHLLVQHEAPAHLIESEFRGGSVFLDRTRTEELDAEGYAREIMRHIQILRKNAGLQKADSISLFIKADSKDMAMLSKWQEAIKEKVGAKRLKISGADPDTKHEHAAAEKIKDKAFGIFFDVV